MKKYLVALLGIFLVFACNQDELNSLMSSSTEQAGVIASINEQVDNINATIDDLKATDIAIDQAISALQDEDAAIRAQLESDKAKIEASIDSLGNYVNEKLQEARDWASATFATLEQYQHLCDSVAAIQQSLVELDSRITAQLKHDLDSLETSMKAWVNEQLTGYYTIAQIDAKLGVLEKAVQDGDKANADAITQLQADLAKQATDLTTAYQAAIASAIEESNGVINEKIANEINTVNTRITNEVKALGDRIDALELRIQAVEDYINSQKAFTISFTMPKDTVCFPGETITVGYEVSESTLPTAIECIPDEGWKVTVHSNGNKGTISITAPNTGGNGKIVVFANRSSWILMSTIKLQEGVLSIDKDVYNAPFEGCVLDIPFSINADFGIKVAEADQSWLHVKETKAAMRNASLSLIVDANPSQFRRVGKVYIYPTDGNNDEYYQLTINQAAALFVTRIWGHYVQPKNVEDDWFQTVTTDIPFSGNYWLRSCAMDDQYLYLAQHRGAAFPAYILSLADGSLVGRLDIEGVTGGTHALSCIRTIPDGNGGYKILQCNLVASEGTLKVYKWDDKDSTPTTVLEYDNVDGFRLGDKMTVIGTWQDGELWFLPSRNDPRKLYIFSIKNGVINPTPTVGELEGLGVASYGQTYKYSDTEVVASAVGGRPILYTVSDNTYTKVLEFDTALFASLDQGFNFFTFNDQKYMAFARVTGDICDCSLRIIPITGDTLQAAIEGWDGTGVFTYGLSDPQEFPITGYRSPNCLADCIVREIGGKIFIAAMSEGAGISLFKIE